MLKITNDTVVAFDYTLTNNDGQVLDSSEGREPLAYLHGHGNIIPGLEKAMLGRAVGDSFTVTIPPSEAYGELEPDLRKRVERAHFRQFDQIQPGMRFSADTNSGKRVFKVIEVSDNSVLLDANHELAGVELTFAVTVRSIRPAQPEEIDHGHVH